MHLKHCFHFKETFPQVNRDWNKDLSKYVSVNIIHKHFKYLTLGGWLMNKHCNHFIQILKATYERIFNSITRYLKYKKTLRKDIINPCF